MTNEKTLQDILKNDTGDYSLTSEDKEWLYMQPVGKEIIFDNNVFSNYQLELSQITATSKKGSNKNE